MAIISSGKGSKSAEGSIRYVQFEKGRKAYRVAFTQGINCSDHYKDAISDFSNVRTAYQKTGGREALHMVLAFSPEEEKRYTQKELFDKAATIAEKTFPNHQIWLGMHDDTDHLHVHLIINSINLENGYKIQVEGRKGMLAIMDKVQTLCKGLDLDVVDNSPQKKEIGTVRTNNIIEHRLIAKGNSWKAHIAQDVYEVLQSTKNKDEFIVGCMNKGIKCDWQDSRKYIVFSYYSSEGKQKARNTNLAKTFTLPELSSKEALLLKLSQNSLTHQQELEQTKPDLSKTPPSHDNVKRSSRKERSFSL